MRILSFIAAAIFFSAQMNAQQQPDAPDTLSVGPIESARLHGAREATEAEKEYARMLAQERQEQQQIDRNLPLVDENGQVMTEGYYYYPLNYALGGWNNWQLHKGLNVNEGASVFAQFGKGARHGAGFTQDVSLMYVTNLSPKATLAVGGYFNNMTWGGDNYTSAGISALLGYRFNEHWSAYAFVQKAFTSDNMAQLGLYDPYWGGYGYGYPYGLGYGYGPYGLGMGYGNGLYSRNMDRIGGGVRYEWGEHNFIQIQVEVDRMPERRWGYDHRRYDYPARY